MLLLAVLVFITGVLSFLSPCTLPVLPAYLAFSARGSKTSVAAKTLMFGLGLALVYLVLGLLAGSVGSLLSEHKDVIARVSGALFIILGVLLLLGRGVPGITVAKNPSRTLAGSFLFGIIFGISWSGCLGPVLGLVLILAANTATALGGAVLLLVYAAGLLLPLLLVSVYLDRLPRNGRVWTFLRGREVRIGRFTAQSTELITAAMLFALGIIFLFRLDAALTTSPLIERLFDLEERIASALGIGLQR